MFDEEIYSAAFSSDELWPQAQLPLRYKGSRALYSSIYYLLEKTEVCCLHNLSTDELWHYYSGGTLRLHLFDTKDKYCSVDLGPDIDEGQCIQFRVNRNIDFGGEVVNGDFVLLHKNLSVARVSGHFRYLRPEGFPEHRKVLPVELALEAKTFSKILKSGLESTFEGDFGSGGDYGYWKFQFGKESLYKRIF